MTKRIRPALVVYAILLVIADACILYYQFAGARQTAVHYDYTLYFWNLLCMRPLLYGSLAALIAELLQQAGILRLPHKAKGICLALAVLLIALYAIVVAEYGGHCDADKIYTVADRLAADFSGSRFSNCPGAV